VIRVLLADDNPVIRHGLAALLQTCEGVVVVGQASNGREAIQLAERLEPDVVLLDVRMPVMDGVEAAGPLSRRARVMMLTYSEEEELVCGAIRAGASGYLVHGRFQPEDLERALHDLVGGGTVLSPSVAGIVFEALRRAPGRIDEEEGPLSLTEREREVMHLLTQGRSNGDIAERLFVTEKTVKNHINHIYAKLGVSSRAEATATWLGITPRETAA
jgi:DNA-binding NarL/FixJ family response regulator